jgi:uncharacterized OB-fold protein
MSARADYAKPLPPATNLSRPFWEATRRNELRLQRCDVCGRHWFPPASNCPQCLSLRYQWSRVSGRGKVWSWIVMHQRYFSAFEQDLPYVVAFVQLEEGPFLISTLVEIERGAIRCDLPVEVLFEQVTSEIHIPKFRALPSPAAGPR